MSEADAEARIRESLEDQLRLREEQGRLQDGLIEMLNLELRECHRRLVEQGQRKTELERLLKVYGDHVEELTRGNGELLEQLKGCAAQVDQLGRANTAMLDQMAEANRVWGRQVADLKRECELHVARYQALHSPPPSGSLLARLRWGMSRVGGVMIRLLR